MRCLVAISIALGLAIAPTAAAAAPASDPAIPGRLRLGVEVAARWFAYSDPLKIATNLRPYDAVGVPLLVLGGEIRPLAWTRRRVLEDLSITGDYAFAPYLTSSLTGGEDIQTSFERGSVALRAPVRLGKDKRAPIVAPLVGYTSLLFDYQETGPLVASLPIVNYKAIRLGVDGRILLAGPLSLLAAFEWLEPIESGPLYTRFRDPRVGGIDAHLGVSLWIARGTELSLQAGYTRFFSSFEPVPGDPYVAGGALDQFGGLKLGIEYAP